MTDENNQTNDPVNQMSADAENPTAENLVSASSESDHHSEQEQVSPGKVLADARQAMGLSLEQAAKELFMTPAKLSALEKDQFDQFNSHIFVRGYLRSYAKLLKISGDHVVEIFDALIASRKPRVAQDVAQVIPENPQKHLWKFIAIIAGGLFAIYLISIWFFDNGHTSEVPTPKVPNASLASNIDNLPATQAQLASVSSAQESKASSVNAASSVASAEATRLPVVATVAKSSASASVATLVQTVSVNSSKKAGLDEITFSFREESWLEVSDSRGDVLATELEPAGGRLTLTGKAPFDVKLGNSPGVDIQLNGKKIPVVPLISSKVLIMKITNQ